MKIKRTVDFTTYGFTRQGSEEKCREFVEVLLRNNLIPQKFGTSDRPRKLFQIEEFVEFWTDMERERGFGIPFIRGDRFYASVGWGGALPYCTFLEISEKNLSNREAVISFVKDLYKWNGSCYGYVISEKYVDRLSSPGFNITDCLPGITWANLFGKPYVDMWGEEKLLNAPTWKTERLNDGGFLLVTTESPLTDRAIACQAEEKLRKYLGEEHFYKKPTEPEFLTREELYEKVFGEHEQEPTGYIAPDFRRYYDI